MPDDFDEWHIIYARLIELASQLADLERLAEHTTRYLAYRPSQVNVALQVAHRLLTDERPDDGWTLVDTVYSDVDGARLSQDYIVGVGQLAERMGDDQRALNWYRRR